jgi:hypothetical protein
MTVRLLARIIKLFTHVEVCTEACFLKCLVIAKTHKLCNHRMLCRACM